MSTKLLTTIFALRTEHGKRYEKEEAKYSIFEGLETTFLFAVARLKPVDVYASNNIYLAPIDEISNFKVAILLNSSNECVTIDILVIGSPYRSLA